MNVFELRAVGPEIDLALKTIAKFTGVPVGIQHRTHIEIADDGVAAAIRNIFGDLVVVQAARATPAVAPVESSTPAVKPPHRSALQLRVCEHCHEPFQPTRQVQTHCAKVECKKAQKKAYMENYWKAINRAAAQETPQQESPLLPPPPPPDSLGVPRFYWTLPNGNILTSGQLAEALSKGFIAEGALIEHSTRGTFRITKRSNGRLAPEQVLLEGPKPAGGSSSPAAPGPAVVTVMVG